LAQRLGITADSLIRAQVGLNHTLQQWSEQGHCAAYSDKLMDMAVQLLEIPESTIPQAVEAELDEGNLTSDLIEGKESVYLSSNRRAKIP